MKPPWMRRSRTQRDAELDEEVRGHLAMAVAERIARGESPDDALASARREFGNVGRVKETTREAWGGIWLDRLRQDVHYAFRSLRRAPGFTAAAVLQLVDHGKLRLDDKVFDVLQLTESKGKDVEFDPRWKKVVG